MKLVEQMLEGDNLALSRLISLVENESSQTLEIMKLISSRLGRAHRIGITGPPGVGKDSGCRSHQSVHRRRGIG
jgi:LAO/AO transport system kinase